MIAEIIEYWISNHSCIVGKTNQSGKDRDVCKNYKNQQNQNKKQQKMNDKDAEQKLKMLEQKEKDLQQRLQNQNKQKGNGQREDW